MEKNDPKVKPQRRQSAVARGILALVLAGLLVVPVIVRAELKAVSRAWSWDDTTNGFECGHVAVEFDVAEDAKWVPLLQEVYFDGLFDREPEEWEPEICEDHDLTTQYAGWLEYGLASLDTDPVDAQGFQGSYEYWYLIDCDLNKDGTWDPVTDLAVSMPITPVLEAGWEAWGQDPLVTCSFDEPHPNCKMPVWDEKNEDVPPATDNHCKEELATQLVISLDTDCDGYVDEDDEPEGVVSTTLANATALCVYSWAKMPSYEPGDDVWSFPLPVRITDADGAKTLMFDFVPTAIDLASFDAEPQGRDMLISWETASEIDNAGFNVYRAEAGGERVRLNAWLIPSQSPGSAVGSSYQFVDRSAEPDTAYEYWLEDIDMSGAAAMNGPLAVQTPRHRFLPSRPRPAPMPQSRR